MVKSSPAKPKSSPARPKAETSVASTEVKQSPDIKQSLESTFLDYLRAVHSASADTQKRGAEIYQAYLREVGESYAELQKRVEDLQREYIAGIQEAFGCDDAAVRAEKAYDDTVNNYRRLMEEAQRQSEQMTKKLVSLLSQQGEDLQKQFAEALTAYLRGLQGATHQLDGANVGLSDLEYLSQSIGTVALYASATGAMPASSSFSA